MSLGLFLEEGADGDGFLSDFLTFWPRDRVSREVKREARLVFTMSVEAFWK